MLGSVPPLHELCQASHHSPMPQFPQQEQQVAPPPVGQDAGIAEQGAGVMLPRMLRGTAHSRGEMPCRDLLCSLSAANPCPSRGHQAQPGAPAAPLHRFPPLTRRHGMPGAVSCRGGGVGRLLPSRRARCPVLSEKLWGRGPCISSSSSALLKRW